MIHLRKASQRGRTQIDWLDSWHSFSFGDSYDPANMGFGPLRVINDDCVAAGSGFGMHPHRDMEIITYVLAGQLEHRDSLGTGSIIRRGDVQRMTAGTGIRHSEFNPSSSEPVHLLQIWLLPERTGLPPSYEQKTFADDAKHNRLRLVAARDGRDGAVAIHQAADVYAALVEPGATLAHQLANERIGWLQVADGAVTVNDVELLAGDGAAIQEEANLTIIGRQPAELLLFDMAGV